MMHIENKIVHGLWIGKSLSPIELLCIKSFQANGHEFHLWVYDTIETTLPENTILEDATKIIPRERVFYYKYSNQFGHGKGSYAGFSDIFRYKLLFEHGGWWADMDVVCLKPLNFCEPFVFRTHHDFLVVGNVMKCPQKSELMRTCYEMASLQIDENNKDWNLPIKILNDTIEKMGLINYIKDFSNPDSWYMVRKLLYKNMDVPQHWYILHLVNEEWRRNDIDKNAIPKHSFLGHLLKKYTLFQDAPWICRCRTMVRAVFIKMPDSQIVIKLICRVLKKWTAQNK